MNAKSIKSIIRTLLLMMVAFTAGAAPLSPDQALRRVENSSSALRMPGNKSYVLKYTEKSNGENILYVFDKGDNGFIVASADDRMPPVLGYSDRGNFDLQKASPEFKWWLSQYASQAGNFFKTEAARSYVYAPARSVMESIPYLMDTEWNQGYPFNLDCPYDANGQSVTGCVATAMAQVIKYHGYPSTGSGTHSYSWHGETLEYNYGEAFFDYDNMLDIYYSDSGEAQKKAVANLMYACGVSVNMDYSSYESGASSIMVLRALKDNFNYDSDIAGLPREVFSDEEWSRIIYDELKAQRPVLYTGSSEEGGHEFVCDGYDDGYFHINWGWGGYCDGWFLLSSLNPDGQGIGGYEGGYNLDQMIVTGMRPDAGSTVSYYPVYATGGFEVYGVYGNSYINMGFSDYGGIWNYSPNEITTNLYLKAVSASGEEFLSEGISIEFPACDGSAWGWTGFYPYLPSVGEGEYKVYVVLDGPQGQLQQLRNSVAYKDYMSMKVDAEGNVSFYDDEKLPELSVTKLSPIGEVVSRKPADFGFSIRNNSEVSYSGPVYIRCYDKSSGEFVTEVSVPVSLKAGEALDEKVSMVFEVAGDYELRCFDMLDNPCSDAIPLTVEENPEVIKVVVTKLQPHGAVISGKETIFDITVVNEGNVEYQDIIHLEIYDRGTDTYRDGYLLWMRLDPGETMDDYYELPIELPNGEYDMRCFDVFGYPCSEVFPLTVGGTVAAPNLVVTEMTPDGDIYSGIPAIFFMSLENRGDAAYSDPLYISVYEAGDSVYSVTQFKFDIYADPGESYGFWTELWFDCPAGDYELRCIDESGNQCGGPFPFTLMDQSESPKVFVYELSQVGDVISGEEAEFFISLQNVGIVDYSGTLEINTYDNNHTLVAQHYLGLNIQPQESVQCNFKAIYNLPDGEYYQVCYDFFNRASSDNLPLAIGKRSVDPVDPTGVSLDKTDVSLVVGQSVTLTAVVEPEDASDMSVTWSSSDPSVATVDEGVVVAVAPGTAVITASTSNGLTAQCAVTVEPLIIYATSISLDLNAIDAEIGSTFTLTATVLPDDTTDKTVAWSSSDETVATVDQEGNVTVIALGGAVITAATTDGSDLYAQCTVNVVSAVNAVMNGSRNVDIYTFDGVLLRKNADSEFVDNLAEGKYIIRSEGRSYKIIKR